MFEFVNIVTPLSPLIAMAAAFIVFLKRRGKKSESGHRSLGLFVLGFFVLGVLFFMLGFFVVNEISCKGAEYAECALGGFLIGGPLGFSAATSIYLYLWGKKGKVL